MDAEVRRLVWERCGGYCEVCGLGLSEDSFDFHHRKLKSRGGKDSAPNGLACHHFCHLVTVHNHPRISAEKGWMVSKYDDELAVPISLGGSQFLLTADGKYQEIAP